MIFDGKILPQQGEIPSTVVVEKYRGNTLKINLPFLGAIFLEVSDFTALTVFPTQV